MHQIQGYWGHQNVSKCRPHSGDICTRENIVSLMHIRTGDTIKFTSYLLTHISKKKMGNEIFILWRLLPSRDI